MYLENYRSSSLVQSYVTGCKMQVRLWKVTIKAVEDCSLLSFVQACPVNKASNTLTLDSFERKCILATKLVI